MKNKEFFMCFVFIIARVVKGRSKIIPSEIKNIYLITCRPSLHNQVTEPYVLKGPFKYYTN